MTIGGTAHRVPVIATTDESSAGGDEAMHDWILTIFLAGPNIALTQQSGHLIQTRLLDTVIGSAIGAIGGVDAVSRTHTFLHKETYAANEGYFEKNEM